MSPSYKIIEYLKLVYTPISNHFINQIISNIQSNDSMSAIKIHFYSCFSVFDVIGNEIKISDNHFDIDIENLTLKLQVKTIYWFTMQMWILCPPLVQSDNCINLIVSCFLLLVLPKSTRKDQSRTKRKCLEIEGNRWASLTW